MVIKGVVLHWRNIISLVLLIILITYIVYPDIFDSVKYWLDSVFLKFFFKYIYDAK